MTVSFSDLLLNAHLQTLRCAWIDVPRGGSVRVARSGRLTFHIVLAGPVHLLLAGRAAAEAVLSTGDIALVGSGEEHVLACGGAAPRGERLRFEREGDLAELPQEPVKGARLVSGVFGGVRAPDAAVIGGLPDIAVERATAGDCGPAFPYFATGDEFALACTGPGGRAFVGAVAHAAFVKQVRRHRAAAPERNADLRSLDLPRVTIAMRLMEGAPDAAWTVASLAEAVGVSRSLLAQQFTGQMGQPPMAWLAELRLARARDWLATTSRSVSDIAHGVGYGSPTAFARSFRRRYGATPREFRAARAGPD